jgi:hypothetical protein
MKKVFTVALLFGVFLACNNGGQTENKKTDTAGEPGHQHQTNTESLELNNGVKWKADSITISNVAALKVIVSGTKKESLENYIQTAEQLQDGLNKMINECKMKEPDHDALHQWLEPLLEETKEIKNATEVKNAQEKLKEIEERINLFAQYFE